MDNNELNCKGMACPMPIIKLNELVKLVSSGETIEIKADDPTFESDIKVWCKRKNYELVSIVHDEGIKAIIKVTHKDGAL